uniref:AT-hook motif nuclear-localized protein n=1 Tax=Lactuca sativa TaxID=4236 RepID=A0A9R1W9B7_LACSA|nr:hypothetical protein LSAT_V11C200058440 [Lactuca sativa]
MFGYELTIDYVHVLESKTGKMTLLLEYVELTFAALEDMKVVLGVLGKKLEDLKILKTLLLMWKKKKTWRSRHCFVIYTRIQHPYIQLFVMKQGLQMEATKINGSDNSKGNNSGNDSPLSSGGIKDYSGGSELVIHVSSGDVGATRNVVSAPVVRKKRGRPRKDKSNEKLRRPFVSPPTLHAKNLRPRPTINLVPSDCVACRGGRMQPPVSVHPPFVNSLCETNSYTTGMDFKAHVIEVSPGEDVTRKILALFQTGPRCISILSANGTIYNVMLRQPGCGSSDVLLKYEVFKYSYSYNFLLHINLIYSAYKIITYHETRDWDMKLN